MLKALNPSNTHTIKQTCQWFWEFFHGNSGKIFWLNSVTSWYDAFSSWRLHDFIPIGGKHHLLSTHRCSCCIPQKPFPCFGKLPAGTVKRPSERIGPKEVIQVVRQHSSQVTIYVHVSLQIYLPSTYIYVYIYIFYLKIEYNMIYIYITSPPLKLVWFVFVFFVAKIFSPI